MTDHATIEDMIADAERQGKDLYCGYQGLRFTPEELRAENAQGRFQWGPCNWKFVSPIDPIATARCMRQEAADLIAKAEALEAKAKK